MTSAGLRFSEPGSGSIEQRSTANVIATAALVNPQDAGIDEGRKSFFLDLQSMLDGPGVAALTEDGTPQSTSRTKDADSGIATASVEASLAAGAGSVTSAHKLLPGELRLRIPATQVPEAVSHCAVSRSESGSPQQHRRASSTSDTDRIEVTKEVRKKDALHPGAANAMFWVPPTQSSLETPKASSSASPSTHDTSDTNARGPIQNSMESPLTTDHEFQGIGDISNTSSESTLNSHDDTAATSISPMLFNVAVKRNENMHSLGSGMPSSEKSIHPGETAVAQNTFTVQETEHVQHTSALNAKGAGTPETYLEIATGPGAILGDRFSEHVKESSTRSREARLESSTARPGIHVGVSPVVINTPTDAPSVLDAPAHIESVPSPSHEVDPLRRPFDALDLQTGETKARWISASGTHAEAGFEDPAIGWITVRAHSDAGGVHASLVPGSIEASRTLAEHIQGLNTHIAVQHPEVHPITLSPPDSGWNSGRLGSEMNHRQGGENGRRDQELSTRDQESVKLAGSVAVASQRPADNLTLRGMSLFSAVDPIVGGTRISIMV